MKYELKSMVHNEVRDLVELLEGHLKVGCKWVFNTKCDSHGNLECYKVRLVAKGFTKKDGINYKETFSPVSKKYSFRIIMALMAHYDLELHQMDVKTVFLNGNLNEEVYMDQPIGFIEKGKNIWCVNLRSQYTNLNKVPDNDTITSFGFKENIVNRCTYLKISGSKFIYLILYIDDILFATNDLGLLHQNKEFLSKNFEMKDMGEEVFFN